MMKDQGSGNYRPIFASRQANHSLRPATQKAPPADDAHSQTVALPIPPLPSDKNDASHKLYFYEPISQTFTPSIAMDTKKITCATKGRAANNICATHKLVPKKGLTRHQTLLHFHTLSN